MHWNLSWDVQERGGDAAVQSSRIALVLWAGREVGHHRAVVLGIEGEFEADGVIDAADETHAGVGLFFHGRSSLWRVQYSIDEGLGKPSAEAPQACLLAAVLCCIIGSG